MKIRDYTPGGVIEQVMITRKPPHYLLKIPGELFFGFQVILTCSITCPKVL